MKVLFVANRWDPRQQDEYSGNDYGAYHAIKNQPEVQLELVGPFNFPPSLMERLYFKFKFLFIKKPIKHSKAYLKNSAKIVQEAIERFQPDVIFSQYCAPFVYVDVKVPFVYLCDSSIVWARDLAKEFSNFTYNQMEKWEEKSIRMSTKVITYSHSNAEVMSERYEKSLKEFVVFPIPSQVPKNLLPDGKTTIKSIRDKINLLFVGKRFHLRGVDIAIEVVEQLNFQGFPTKLHIVGMEGKDSENVVFKGVFNKEQTSGVEAYFKNFEWADLLIHPARFHSAGIVISEAAGFGVPTITNDAGGLATTVKDGYTGIVLPKHSPAELYVEKIKALMKDEEKYQSMQVSARSRFDEELHWDVASKKLFDVVLSATKH